MSPIHDQGYRRYAGTRAPHGRTWAVIAAAGVRRMFAKRAFLALLLLSWFPFFARAIQIYASANVPGAEFLAPTPQLFRDFLETQEIFAFFITVYVGAGLIANDRRANALQIYLSKPLTRLEYVFGKLAVLLAFLLLVTFVPALVLLLVQVMFAGNLTFLRQNLYLFPAITVYSFVQVITVSIAMLALSSLSRSSRYVGILYAVLIFFSQALYGVLYAVTASSDAAWVSLSHNLTQLGDAIFRLPLRYDVPLALSALIVVSVIGGSMLVLERRVRGVEVIT